MATGSRRTLPLSIRVVESPPSVDAVRKRLGGRQSTEPGSGEIVALTARDGTEQVAVVLFVRGDTLDLWLDGIIRRVSRADVSAPGRTPSSELIAMANDARVFGQLVEGQMVQYEREGTILSAKLIEKCRFGALLLREDGSIVGVGFRKVWPSGQGQGGVTH
jgi:hypothetical protein